MGLTTSGFLSYQHVAAIASIAYYLDGLVTYLTESITFHIRTLGSVVTFMSALVVTTIATHYVYTILRPGGFISCIRWPQPGQKLHGNEVSRCLLSTSKKPFHTPNIQPFCNTPLECLTYRSSSICLNWSQHIMSVYPHIVLSGR